MDDFFQEFAILDSASNKIIIPYTLGRMIKLSSPESKEEFKSVSGVEGKGLKCVERPCKIYLVHKGEKKLYGFYGNVFWLHPALETLREIRIAEKKYGKSKDLREKTRQKERIKQLTLKFERSGIILGRSFFDNFEYIKFYQNKDNGFFDYKMKESKINDIKEIG